MIDYHIHTKLCKHAHGEIKAYVEEAIKLGLTEIVFTDHIPLPDEFDLAHRMSLQELDVYAIWIDELRSAYPEITIKFGIEADYYEGFEEFTDKILSKYDFDVVIMSIHFLRHWPEGNWVFNYHFPDRPITDIYNDYLSTLIQGIGTGLFDIVGHADIIKSKENSFIARVPEKVNQLLEAIKDQNMVIEINTSGYRKEINQPYPGLDWLEILKKLEVPLTIGSDAHAPEQVALNFKNVLTAIRESGISTLYTFDKRKKKAVNIEDMKLLK